MSAAVTARRPQFGRREPEKLSDRPLLAVEVLDFEAERLPQLLHALLELHASLAEALDLVVGERAGFHAADGLSLHELAEQFDDRQRELREAALDVVRVGVDARRQAGVELVEPAEQVVEVAGRGAGEDLLEDV